MIIPSGCARREIPPGAPAHSTSCRDPYVLEVVAICDHLTLLFNRKSEHEVSRETLPIALHLFVEAFGGDPVKSSEVHVQDNLLAPNKEDGALDSLSWYEVFHRVL